MIDILKWFDPSLHNFDPICVRDFLNNGVLHITDGHTRAFVAWTYGLRQIRCIYDESEIVSCQLGQIQYEEDIVWCNRFYLTHIFDLADRVLSEDDYEELWRGRCDKMYNLKVALLEGKICPYEFEFTKNKLEHGGLFIYGISEDLNRIFYEDAQSELFEAPYTRI